MEPYQKRRKDERGGDDYRQSLPASAQQVADHYGGRKNQSREERKDSKILSLRGFNNWIKSMLISTYCKPGYSVLDICGGKGGDLNKWKKMRVGHLVLADVALKSIEDAVDRYNKLYPAATFPAIFIAKDCFKEGLTSLDATHLPHDLRFQMVSSMFSMHYSWESETRVRGFLENVSTRLDPGGVFIGTIPNANLLVARARFEGRKEFGNSVYKIGFDIPGETNELDQEYDFPIFGCKYYFQLVESVDNVPEYLVHFPTFRKIALEYGLELVYKASFEKFYAECIETYEARELLGKMNCLNEEGTINKDEWEAIGNYY
eukprot:TRINITY_DN2709_c0_g1_i1.p1 TRINITY_DN2709_c0_g1~~TRINITY_DN2709_c0_g1_i1.p1  ORF type:complete len:318 (-),score=49.34 TRINITY_DN2709_c0_g1_i1:229-1182(-)